MTMSLILGFIWVLLATAIALMPQRTHWPGAVGLIATGIPLVGYITWQNGPLMGVLALVAGASILRWPLFYLGHWLKRRVGGGE
jgi:hypothetical protein